MKRIISTKYSTGAFNFAMFILRVSTGVLMASHGFTKLVHFSTMKNHFMNFMGMGSTASLALVVFTEFFCSIFLILGLFTRMACIPIIIEMAVIVFIVTHGNVFGEGERAALYLAATLTLLFLGPGKISVDGMIGK